VSFNLVYDAFIPAFTKDGKSELYSIEGLFDNSKNIVRLSGDSPVQEFVFIRLLLAVLYRSLKPSGRSDWLELWNDGLPVEEIKSYLRNYQNRFELIDENTPFYQIVGSEYENDGTNISNIPLLLDAKSVGTQGLSHRFLFSTYTNKGASRLELAQAARKLIENQNYNVAARRPVLKGDPRKNKRSYAQIGWAGNITGLVILGNNLEETLLLNMPPYDFLDIDPELDSALWEREQHTVVPEGLHGTEDESETPLGPAYTYTHQSSRITLVPSSDGEYIIGSIVGIGDRLFRYDKQNIEPMSSWRQTTRQDGSEAFVPVRSSSNQIWKNLAALVARNPADKKDQILARNLAWYDRVYPAIKERVGTHARVCTFTALYGTQDAIIEDFIAGQVTLSSETFHNPDVMDAIIFAVSKALEIGSSVTYLKNDINIAAGGEGTFKGASEDFLDVIGREFEKWAVQVHSDNIDSSLNEWKKILESHSYIFESEIVNNAPPRAIGGRVVKERQVNVFTAAAKFRARNRKCLS